MLLKDSVLINASADRVWEYVGSPDLWPLFHAKAGNCEQLSAQGGAIGSLYEMEFSLGSKTSPTKCEIIDLRVGQTIQLKSTLPGLNPKTGQPDAAVITYELQDRGFKTKVYEQIHLDLSSVNPLLRVLAWLIHRLGKPSGETSLRKLKKIVEEDAAPLPGA
ncbi:MAG: SRPBCC family protein [Pirellulales bacterium]|nr:SRPBCC family protein [Pirellulales bacterium]